MLYTKIPYVEKPVSRMVFGTGIASMKKGETPFDLLDEVYAAGINTFDTAISYGDSEVSLGEWVASRNLRGQVVVISKGARPDNWRKRVTTYDIMSDIETSFAKLKMKYIDIYFLHRDDLDVPVGPIVELLNQLHREGRIGAFGGSNWSHQRLEQANRYAREHDLVPFSVSSPNFCLAEMLGDPFGGSVTLAGEKNKEARDYYVKNDIPAFAYSSLGRGFFSGRIKSGETEKANEVLGLAAQEYGFPENFERLRRAEVLAAQKGVSIAQIAFAWLFKQKVHVLPITSPTSSKHLHESICAMHMDLTDNEVNWLSLEAEQL